MPRYVRGGRGLPSLVKKRSVVIDGLRTSVSIEDLFWKMLSQHALRSGHTISSYVTQLSKKAGQSNLSSAIRLKVLELAKEGLV